MSRKLNKLRNRFQILQKELSHKIWMLKYSHKEYEILENRYKELQSRMNKITSFESYNDDLKQEILYTMRISRIELVRNKNPKEMIDYVINHFRYQFFNYADRHSK